MNDVTESYQRLLENGKWFWTEDMMPDDLLSPETQRVLDTKDEFVTLLETTAGQEIVDDLLASDFERDLLLNHCMLATDVGKETLDRIAPYLAQKSITETEIDAPGVDTEYAFRALGTDYTHGITNTPLADLSDRVVRDVLTVLSFGAYMDAFDEFITFDRCRLGGICGDDGRIADYFADLYVLFSPQTRGRLAVKKGKAAEDLVAGLLDDVVTADPTLEYADGSRVPDMPTEGEAQEFDFVLRRDGRYVAIECAFQETTNSTLERKARQSRELYPIFERRGFDLVHVVDGAGYFERENALQQMVEYSDLTITFNELGDLREFLHA